MQWLSAASFACLLTSAFRISSCLPRGYGLSFHTNSPFGNDSFVFAVGDTATITTTLWWELDNTWYIRLYWSKQDGTDILCYIFKRDYEEVPSIRNYNTNHNINLSWSFSSQELQLTTTLASIQTAANQSTYRFQAHFSESFYTETPSFTLLCCDSILDELGLVTLSKGSCLNESLAVCKNGNAFHPQSGEYLSPVKLSCRHAKWIGEFQCLRQSCPRPQQGKFLASKSFARYKIGAPLAVKCAQGKIYIRKQPKRFVETYEISCQENETWSGLNEVECWEGSIVNFLSKKITLRSGENTVFACEARNQLRSAMVILDEQIYGDETTWANITMTSDHNGVVAACREIDAFNQTVYEKKTYLNVQYPPEVVGDTSLFQEFGLYTSGRVTVSFRANPTLQMSDINILKDGRKFLTYSLEVNGSHHNIVLDFDRVLEEDFGDYVIRVTSTVPVYSTLLVGIKVADAESPVYSTVLGGITDADAESSTLRAGIKDADAESPVYSTLLAGITDADAESPVYPTLLAVIKDADAESPVYSTLLAGIKDADAESPVYSTLLAGYKVADAESPVYSTLLAGIKDDDAESPVYPTLLAVLKDADTESPQSTELNAGSISAIVLAILLLGLIVVTAIYVIFTKKHKASKAGHINWEINATYQDRDQTDSEDDGSQPSY